MAEIENYTKALETLKEYAASDGLHIDTLLDSDKHGALTYNDFLILPNSISKRFTFPELSCWGLLISKFAISVPSIGSEFRNQGHQEIFLEGTSCLIPHGHCHRA